MIVFSDRDTYIGGHVRPETKDALRAEASKRGISLSALLSEMLEEKLRELRA